MANLNRASRELFARQADERFASLDDLADHCRNQSAASQEIWIPPRVLRTNSVDTDRLLLASDEQAFQMNDWSFSQLCRLAGVGKDTVNRLSPDTASRVFAETLTGGEKPLQLFIQGTDGADALGRLRSIHAASYTRLANVELLDVIEEFSGDFQPPPPGVNGGTGLYAGEQDCFLFLIDPAGWVEIEGESFAPGFFAWNSEVGRRSVGIQTFWYQRICANHLVWDARDVVELARKHTSGVRDALPEIRAAIEGLVRRRDERRDGFARAIRAAMGTKLGDEQDDVLAQLAKHGFSRALVREAMALVPPFSGFTVFAMVDALTRVAGKLENAGDRTEADQKAASLLALAA